MAKFASMPLFTDAYLADTGHLSTFEHGAYLLILMCMWRSGGKLPNDDEKLARYAKCTKGQWKKIKDTMLEFFDETDGFITQGRLSDELSRLESLSQSQQNKAKARWLKRKKTSNAGAMPPTPTPITTPTESPTSSESHQGDSGDTVINGAAPNGSAHENLSIQEKLDRNLYIAGKKLLGKNSGGQITRLKNFLGVGGALDALAMAEKKQDPREYIAGIIRSNGKAHEEQSCLI